MEQSAALKLTAVRSNLWQTPSGISGVHLTQPQAASPGQANCWSTRLTVAYSPSLMATLLLKLVRGGGGGGGEPLRYLHVDGTGTQNLSTTAITLDFDTTIATSAAGDFTVGTGGEITVVNAGNYYVEYSATGDQTAGNNRIIVSAQLEVNGTVVTGITS